MITFISIVSVCDLSVWLSPLISFFLFYLRVYYINNAVVLTHQRSAFMRSLHVCVLFTANPFSTIEFQILRIRNLSGLFRYAIADYIVRYKCTPIFAFYYFFLINSWLNRVQDSVILHTRICRYSISFAEIVEHTSKLCVKVFLILFFKVTVSRRDRASWPYTASKRCYYYRQVNHTRRYVVTHNKYCCV